LVQAIAKNDNMDLIIQKAVELGVHQVTPIITERTIVKIATNQITKKIDHWQSIAINACCQCGRNIIPKVNPALVFNDFIKNNFFNKFILSPTIKFLKDGQKLQMDLAKEIILLIGPEGGFSNKEMELAVQNQYLPINIGPRVLRTETASLVALSIFQYQYGDLNKNDNYSLR